MDILERQNRRELVRICCGGKVRLPAALALPGATETLQTSSQHPPGPGNSCVPAAGHRTNNGNSPSSFHRDWLQRGARVVRCIQPVSQA